MLIQVRLTILLAVLGLGLAGCGWATGGGGKSYWYNASAPGGSSQISHTTLCAQLRYEKAHARPAHHRFNWPKTVQTVFTKLGCSPVGPQINPFGSRLRRSRM